MLASPSPRLVSSLQPSSCAVGADAPGDGEAASGFAELLDGLSVRTAGEPASGGSSAEQELDLDAAARAMAVAVAASLDRPAASAQAAGESGKDLPVDLPEAAEADGEAGSGAQIAALASNPFALLTAPTALAPTPLSAGAGQRARSAATASQRPAAHTPQPLPATAATAKGKPGPDARAAEGTSVSISVAAPGAQADEGAGPEPARARPAHAVDLPRVEAPLSQPSASAPSLSQADRLAPAATPLAVPAAAPAPSAADINAALDRLVAAREALMPAEAALAIDHAEFGEVSIRIDQSADGRLSAELAAADPELQRAVTAAMAADRGTASDSQNGRSAQLANHRGSAAGGDAATGERGQPGGSDRDPSQPRGASRSAARQGADPRPGIFA